MITGFKKENTPQRGVFSRGSQTHAPDMKIRWAPYLIRIIRNLLRVLGTNHDFRQPEHYVIGTYVMRPQ